MGPNDPEIRKIAEKIATGGGTVFFTGAGISTESGIPDFRGKSGVWERFTPVYYDDFMAEKSARIEYWRQKSAFYADLKNARPNAAHKAVARLWEMGKVSAVITQNIDGLHQSAGVPHDAVIELHGSNRRARCMACGKIVDIEECHQRVLDGDLAPDCACGGPLKPDTVSFGQAMPEAEVQRAVELSLSCRTFVAVGSTLQVHPAALIPGYAKRSGAFLALVNLSSTPLDGLFDVIVTQKAGDALEQIARAAALLV